MSEPPSHKAMKHINDELDETSSLCPKEGLFQRLGTQLWSAISRSSAGFRDTALSHRDDSVVPHTIPGTFPDSDQSQQAGQSRSGVGERFDKDESGDEGHDGDEVWDDPEVFGSRRGGALPTSYRYDTTRCLRDLPHLAHRDNTSYSHTGGIERSDETKADA